MNENTAKINVELDANGDTTVQMEGTADNLLALAILCIDDVLKANYCCKGHLILAKAEITAAILGIEAPKDNAKKGE